MDNRGIAREQVLTSRQLAEVIGPRRAGKATRPDTVWDWIKFGCNGIRLPAAFNGISYEITWGDYLDWRRKVNEARERARQRRLEAVQGVKDRGKRAARARQRLAAQGAI